MWFTLYHIIGPNMSDHKAKRILPMSKCAKLKASHRRKFFLLQPLAETVFSLIFQNIQSLREYTQPFL